MKLILYRRKDRMTTEEFRDKILTAKDKMFRLAKRLLREPSDAEDALQEVFVKLWTKRHQLHEYNNIEAFAMSVTKNYCLDQLRAKKHNTLAIDQATSVCETRTPEKLSEMKDSSNYIQKAMDALPEQQKIIIQLRDIEGYSFEEMQDMLNISVNTIRVNLSRARKKIREQLIKIHNYESETT